MVSQLVTVKGDWSDSKTTSQAHTKKKNDCYGESSSVGSFLGDFLRKETVGGATALVAAAIAVIGELPGGGRV